MAGSFFPLWQSGLCLALGLLAAWLFLGPQHDAGFWAIDDHELISFYTGVIPENPEPVALSGPNNTLTIADIPTMLMHTEVGGPGRYLRYRPVYYILRLLEVSLWGDNPAPYYDVRTVLFGIMLAAILLTGWLATGFLGATLLVLLTLNWAMWGAVWCRLGTAEQYTSFSLSLFLLAFSVEVRSLFRRDDASWTAPTLILGVALIIGAGSKENFVFMAVPVLAMTALGLYQRRVRAWATIPVGIGLMIAILVAGSVALAMSRAGRDFYGNTVSVTSRLNSLVLFVRQYGSGGRFDLHAQLTDTTTLIGTAIALPVAIALIWVLWRSLSKTLRAAYRDKLAFVVAINALAIAWLAWEIIFYHGDWPNANHYDFPGMLILVVFAGSALTLITQLFRPTRLRQILGVIGFTGFIIVQAAIGFDFPISQAVAQNLLRTREFSGDLEHLVAESATHPDWPIYIEMDRAWDFEPVVTFTNWVRWRHIQNKVFLRVHAPEPGPANSAFDEGLLKTMRRVSSEGRDGYQSTATLDPEQEVAGHCYSVSYSGPVTPSCVALPLRFM